MIRGIKPPKQYGYRPVIFEETRSYVDRRVRLTKEIERMKLRVYRFKEAQDIVAALATWTGTLVEFFVDLLKNQSEYKSDPEMTDEDSD